MRPAHRPRRLRRRLPVSARTSAAGAAGVCDVATRFYLPSSDTLAAPQVAPAFTLQAAWNETDNADRLTMRTAKCASAMASKTEAKATTANVRQLMRQFISEPLRAQTIAGACTVKGTIRCLESAVNDNIDKVSCKLIVITPTLTLRGSLLVLGDYGPTNEWDTVLEARRIADGDTVAGAVVCSEGDRLVCEIGYNNTTTGTSVSGTMSFGDNAATDLPDNETEQTALNPFIELSQDLLFFADITTPPQYAMRASGFVGRAFR